MRFLRFLLALSFGEVGREFRADRLSYNGGHVSYVGKYERNVTFECWVGGANMIDLWRVYSNVVDLLTYKVYGTRLVTSKFQQTDQPTMDRSTERTVFICISMLQYSRIYEFFMSHRRLPPLLSVRKNITLVPITRGSARDLHTLLTYTFYLMNIDCSESE